MRTTGLSYAWFAAFLFLVGATVVGCGESGDEAPTDKTSAKSTKSEPPPTYLPGMPFAITKMAVKKIGISGPAVFSPSGDDVLTASYGQSVLWDAKKGLVRRTFKTKGFTVKSVAFSPNGRLVLCGGARTKGQPSTSPTSRPAKGAKRETVGEATLWNLGSTEAAQTFTGHGKGVSRAIFSPDGRQVLTGADDGTVALWDLKTSKRTRTLKVARKDPIPEFAERVRFLQLGLRHAQLANELMMSLDPAESWGRKIAPKDDPERLAKSRQLLGDLIAFRRAHEHLHISDYLDASLRENRAVLDMAELLEAIR